MKVKILEDIIRYSVAYGVLYVGVYVSTGVWFPGSYTWEALVFLISALIFSGIVRRTKV